MRRKLVKQGPSSLTISLPKDWIERFNLKRGDEVDLEEIETKILISNLNKVSEKPREFDLQKVPEKSIKEFFVGIYKSGLRDIIINNATKSQIKEIKEVIQNTIGLEIIDLSESKIHIVDIGMPDEITLSKTENQIFWKLINIVELILEGKRQEDIFLADMEINRLCFFIQRNLSTKFSPNKDTFLRYERISILEEIGDSIRSFSKIYKNKKDENYFLSELKIMLNKFRILNEKCEDNKIYELKEDIENIKKKITDSKSVGLDSKTSIKDVLHRLSSFHENLLSTTLIGKPNL